MAPLIHLGTRILLVDDFELVRTVFRQAFADLGYTRIDEARDGQGGLDKIRDAQAALDPYGLVFLDWNMPGLSGIDVLKACRAQPGLSFLPIVLVTAESDRKYVLKALMAGATDYIVKPCSTDILAGKIEHINQASERKAS